MKICSFKNEKNILPLEMKNCVSSCQTDQEVSVSSLPDKKYENGVAAFGISKREKKKLEGTR